MGQYIPIAFSKFMSFFLPIILMLSGTTAARLDYSDRLGDADYTGLCEAYEDYFLIGAAINPPQLDINNPDSPRLVAHILKNFNSVSPEWGFGQGSINPAEGVWDYGDADLIANFARDNGLTMRGHPVMWSGHVTWMAYTDETRTQLVSKEVLFERMDVFIREIFERYTDVVHEWNIINEPFHHDRSKVFKDESPWYRIAGEEYVTKAFEIAAKYADEHDRFFVNETFVENNPAKADNMFNTVERWLKAGVPIHGIGLQGHMDTISINANAFTVKRLVQRARNLGLEVQITEMDMKMNMSQRVTTFTELPAWLELWQVNKYRNMFKVFRDNRDTVTNVTFWGIDDAHTICAYSYVTDSWREDWPLLFDRNSMPKQAFYAVCDF